MSIHNLLRCVTVALLLAVTTMPAGAQYWSGDNRRVRERHSRTNSYGDVVEIRTRDAGTLETQFPKDMIDRVRLLHIDGPLDAYDFKFIKKLCTRSRCVDSRGRSTDNFLDLELERARIISAGGTGLLDNRGERDVLGDGLNYATHLRSLVLPERLKRIDNNALTGCHNLEEVIMPQGVRSIGHRAFCNCSRLEYVTLPEGLQSIGDECFSGCSKLTAVTLPRSLSEIGEKAFASTGLRRIALPAGLAELGKRAFEKTDITELLLPAATRVNGDDFGSMPKLVDIGVENGSRHYSTEDGVLYDASGERLLVMPAARSGRFAVPDGVTDIAANAFANCGLSAITLPESLISIGNNAFIGCKQLTRLELPASVTTVGVAAFQRCTNLQQIDMPGVIRMGKSAFADCTSLHTLDIGDQLTSIPQQAFENCAGLAAFDVPAAVAAIGEKAFKGCAGLTRVALPNGLTTIGKEAFRECTSLTAIALPSSCTTVEKEAFRQCKALARADLGGTLTTIGDNALRETAIIKLVLPATVTRVGKKVAEKCPQLQRIECHAPTPPQLDKVSNDKLELYVPAQCVEAYKQAKNWKNFKRILPLP